MPVRLLLDHTDTWLIADISPAIWTHDTNLEASDDEASIKSDARLRIGHLTEQLLSTSSAPLSDTNDKEPSEMIAPLVSAEDELAQSHEANNEACVTNQQHQASVIRCEGTGEAGSNISLGVPSKSVINYSSGPDHDRCLGRSDILWFFIRDCIRIKLRYSLTRLIYQRFVYRWSHHPVKHFTP